MVLEMKEDIDPVPELWMRVSMMGAGAATFARLFLDPDATLDKAEAQLLSYAKIATAGWLVFGNHFDRPLYSPCHLDNGVVVLYTEM